MCQAQKGQMRGREIPGCRPDLVPILSRSQSVSRQSFEFGLVCPPTEAHANHITNVEEDGSIPAMPKPNWSTPGLNNFCQNKQPDSEFGAPDAIVSIAPLCQGDSYSLVAVVRNVGEASLPAGVIVGFYTGDPPNGTKVGEMITSKALYPLESEILELPFDAAPDAVKNGIINIYAVVDDTKIAHPAWQECRTDNNIGTNNGKCLIPN